MPDIGLLQGPPRPRLVAVPTLPAAAEPPRARDVPMPALALTEESQAIRVAAHAAVVSDAPFAVLEAPGDAVPEDDASAAAAPEADARDSVQEADAPRETPVLLTAALVETPARAVPDITMAVARRGFVEEPVHATSPSMQSEPDPETSPVLQAAHAAPASAAAFNETPGKSRNPLPGTGSPLGDPAVPPSTPLQPAFAPSPIRASDLLWLLLALALIIGTGLGIRDPWPADEPRFASLARDMVQSGEWLFPRVGGDLYQDKPPVFFWMLAVCFTVFGSVKAAFLIPALLAAGGVMFLVYDFGRRTVSREAGLGAAILVTSSLQFVLAFRGAQIDPVLCLLTTASMYALLRHLMLGDGWRWYFLGGLFAGIGIVTKGVGFLPMLLLIPFFPLRALGWKGLATLDSGRGGWRWWLAPLAMLLAVSLWFVPMLLAVSASGSPEYAAYRDEILFKQTVGRYAAAWHHVKGWYYFLVEVIPPLWLPWSLLLFWLVPRFKAAFHERNARVWLPLFWVMLVVLFFSMSPGKRGIYIMPALPALALASLPLLPGLIARRGVRIAGWALALVFWSAGLLALIAVYAAKADLLGATAKDDLSQLPAQPLLIAFVALGGAGLLWARARAPLAAWPATLAALCVSFSYFLAPVMNGERSGSEFIRAALHDVKPGEQLGLVAYKEQFLLYLDRPTVNFGHRRWQEGPQEYFDAAAWLNAGANRVLLVPEEALMPKDRFNPHQPAVPCFEANVQDVGVSSGDHWYLVRAPAESACAALGDASRAIRYH